MVGCPSNWAKDSILKHCEEWDIDSLLMNFKALPSYVIWVYGMPAIS